MIEEEKTKLLIRIMDFDIGSSDSVLPFSARLAREQSWTQAYSWRVIIEYKRFMALALLSGHHVTPSEEVDQAWHLHMLYTRNYWHDFCRDTLGRDIHHGPTQGGNDEGKKFYNWYSKTLKSYKELFKEEPPEDIWPSPVRRFTNAGARKWYDSSHYILIPWPPFLRPSYWRKFFRKT